MVEVPDNFLGIPEIPPDEADVVALPIPLELTVSYGHGTKRGPSALIRASQQVEFFDHELGYEVQGKVKISTLPEVRLEGKNAEGAQEAIYEAAKPWIDKFLLSFGGEHSITPALVRAYKEKYPDLSIVYFDAHTDMREQYDGSRWSHASAARRCQDDYHVKTIVWVGIRNTSQEEQQYIDQDFVNYGDRYN